MAGDPRKNARPIDLLQRLFFVQQREVRLRSMVEIGGGLGAAFLFGNHTRRHGVHFRARSETDLHVEAKTFVERRFQSGQRFRSPESLRPGYER